MQGSFWKTVALVAVIGVGSLAVLEVQDRLKDSPSVLQASASSNDESLANDLKSVSEKSINAELEDSEFDKMLKAGFSSSPSDQQASGTLTSGDVGGHTAFDLSEPGSTGDQTFDTKPQDMASQFALADTPSGQTGGRVDTQVDMASLTDGPNPFEFASTSGADERVTEDSQIKPVGFVADDQQSSGSESASPFAAFDAESFDGMASTESTALSAISGAAATDSATETAGSTREVGQMEFFSGDSVESPGNESRRTVQASPAAFENDFTGDDSNDGSSIGGGFDQFPAGGSDLEDSSGSAAPFSGFSLDEDQPAETTAEPKFSNEPDGVGDRSPFFQPDSDVAPTGGNEFVPLPRDQFGEQQLDSPSEPRGSGGSFDDTPEGTQSLPFAEDSDMDVPVLNSGNSGSDFGADEGLEIPTSGFDRGRESSGRDLATPGFNSGSDFRDFPASDLRGDDTFDSRPPARTTPNSPWESNPIDRMDIDSRRARDSDFDRRERTFGNEERDLLEDGVNPNFDAAPGRIPVIEDRPESRRAPVGGDPPLSIDPEFSTDRSSPSRDIGFQGRTRSDEFDARGTGSRSIREFGGSEISPSFPSRSRDDGGRFDDQPIGSGPLGGRREFGDALTDRQRDNLRLEGDRFGGDVRQVASVMRPKLVLEKSAPENATVGTPLQYSITIRNDGDAPAYDVVVEDEVTTAGRVDAAKPQASRTNDGERLIWEFDSISPGTEKEIQVQVTPTGEGVIDGVATVKFKSRVKATTTITAPRLQLRMEGPAKVRLGDKVQYLYTIVNEGSGEARSVFVRTVLPQNGGLRHPQGQDLEYEIPLMAPGERREILLSVVAGEPGSQQAQAIVTSRNGSKDEAVWNTDVIGAQLQMLRRGPKRRFVSKTARYENIVTNETDFDAVNARVVEQIPPGMEFKAAGQGGRYDATQRTVTWEIQRLAAKATTTLQLELEPRVAGQQDSRVMIYENIGAQSDDYVSTTVVEDLHNVSATISQLEGPVALGEGFGFTVTVDNRGTADATDVQLTIQVPREIKVDGAGTQDIHAGLIEETNTVVYRKVVRIRPNQKQDFELKLRGVRPGRNLIVKAAVQSSQMDEPLDVSESVTIYDDRN